MRSWATWPPRSVRSPMLSDAERGALLRTARDAITRHLHDDSSPRVDDALGQDPSPRVDDALAQGKPYPTPSGVFVTIRRRGELRGCLGVLQMRGTLAEEIARCARDSATSDPRFAPMTPDELSDVSLEISVLGPMEEIDPGDEATIVIGRHGLLVEQGARRGLLLPQVATEWGWTPEQFLRQTCRKAQLPETAFRSGARVFRFDAEVFGEDA